MNTMNLDEALMPLLAAALPLPCVPRPAPHPVPSRVMARVSHSVACNAGFTTLRRRHMASVAVAAGVQQRPLYQAHSATLRPGEPARATLLELEPGAACTLPAAPDAAQREWLVLRGSVQFESMLLARHGFHRATATAAHLHSAEGALLYLRESYGSPANAALTQHDSPELWAPFAPGIQRRLMWTDGRQAALLYRVAAGAEVPHHGHGHDEECLMLAGDLFLNDLLLREGDYQLAPAGSEHQAVSTDTGCTLFAHGDVELDLTAKD
jgi:hypothetical protein